VITASVAIELQSPGADGTVTPGLDPSLRGPTAVIPECPRASTMNTANLVSAQRQAGVAHLGAG